MRAFDKSPVELVNFYQQLMADFPQAVLRKTFGYPCAYINNQMTTGLFADSMFLRLNPSDEAEFLKIPGATSFAPMKARPMKCYVVVPEDVRASNELLHAWIACSLEFTANLPPKEKRTVQETPLGFSTSAT